MHLVNALLALTATSCSSVFGAAISLRSSDCHQNHFPGPINPSFETGTLDGWTVVSGNAFGNASLSSATSYLGGPFNQVGRYFLWGLTQSGESATGWLQSSTFKASSVMSFLVSGGMDSANLYIGLVTESDGKLVLSQTGMNDEAFVRIVWDTSK